MTETQLRRGELAEIAAQLVSWPDPGVDDPSASSIARRIRDAASSAASHPETVGPGDLAALLRHLLRSAQAIGDPAIIEVPSVAPWPTDEVLSEHGLEVTPQPSQRLLLTATKWTPSWLGVAPSDRDPSSLAFAGERVRSPQTIPSDPFFEASTGYRSYLSPGQQEAVRTLVFSPPDASIIAALPTGSGKSAVAYLPSLLEASGVVVVVVPTTALAIDQERAFRELVLSLERGAEYPIELAYHGELPPESREGIRARIADGTQRIVFTSPESLVGSLSSRLFRAAEAGHIRLFAVDEAHIVDEWGADFRPEFQQLGAFRDALRAASPVGLKSLFLSGTFTDESLQTLHRLFPAETHYTIGAMDLRSEPSYWPSYAPSLAEREQRVIELLRNLPRPLIIYVTTREDARHWGRRLLELGYVRSAVVAGETPASERKKVIEKLRSGSLDTVAANSAFGLGVDQPDIRSIVHACIPETLNRYYQEVGRGGRDGRAAISILVATDDDMPVAKSLVRETLIGREKGQSRWELMISNGEVVKDAPGHFRVPLDAVPPWLQGDNDENRAWNVRTLLLMERAGLLRLHAAAPPRLAPDASDDDWRAALDDHSRHALVSVLVGNLADDEAWIPFDQAREQAAIGAWREHERMLSVFGSDASICAGLVETYTLTNAFADSLPPGRTCAGCPGCRTEGVVPRLHPLSQPPPTDGLAVDWAETVLELFSGAHVLVVTYAGEQWPSAVESALGRLPGSGVRSIYGGQDVRSWKGLQRLHLVHGPVCVTELPYRNVMAPRVPTAVVLGPDVDPATADLSTAGPRRIVLCREDAPHPGHPTATIGEYADSAVALDVLLSRF